MKKPIYKRWWAWVIAVIVVFAVIGAFTDNSQPTGSPGADTNTASTTKPSTNQTPSTSNSTNTATNNTTAASKPPTNNQNQDDAAFLKAVNGITYDTFLEATNVGDQMTQVGQSQISMKDFADFMDSDRVLWDMYIKQIQLTKPQDAVLQETKQEILTDLKKLQQDAQTMENAAQKNDVDTILSAGQDITVTLNHIKQPYTVAVAQMSKFNIQSNWNG